MVGLTKEQVEESRAKHGTNSLSEQATESFWSKLKDNLSDPMIKILCVALIINIVFTFMGQAEWFESVGIAVAILLATFISTLSEYKNESAFKHLQEEASKILCKVYRDGEITEIPIDDIVVGDCVLLQSGDKVPADGHLLSGSIFVDQMVLNGEAAEVEKLPSTEPLGTDFFDPYSVFRGSVVCSGSAILVVDLVGDASQYGRIAAELQTEDDRPTPLKLKLSHLAHQISTFGYIGGVAIAIAYLLKVGFGGSWMVFGHNVITAIMFAAIIIVMAVPEGLPMMIAIVSAQNMNKMLKDQVLVRRINGVETAGSLNILFTDKTGTVTKGQLEVVSFVDSLTNTYTSFTEIPSVLKKQIYLNATYNTGAVVSGDKVIGGNATERALLSYVKDYKSCEPLTLTASIPFNSTNKYSAVSVDGYSLIKGAPEKILPHCKNVDVDAAVKAMAHRAFRVLALATCDSEIVDDSLPEGDWTLIGLVGIRDEVRPEAVSAIEEVKRAGVQVVMITGDQKDTATAIAQESGLLPGKVLTSDELSAMTDEEVAAILPELRVIARALPTDKSRLVEIAQSLNLVVGMTGDGVNDSIALKRSDVGFAMGSGTEVAKESSEIVVLDDNFNSIDRAILYGRTIFNSIRKFIVFQLTINVSAVLISLVAPLLGMDSPLSITQILWVNLVMDTLAALAFGGEPALSRYMDEAPKRRDEPIVSKKMWAAILVGAGWTFLLSSYILFASHIYTSKESLLTGYFTFFIFTAVFNAFNARTDEIFLFDNITKNKGFLVVIAIIVVVQILLTTFGGNIFRCYGLSVNEWFSTIVMAVSIIPMDIIRKLLTNKEDH